MRLYKHLTEKWIKSFKGWAHNKSPEGDIVEVFENPTKREFRDVAGKTTWDALKGEFVRFFADIENRKVYIWHPETIHQTAWKHIGDSRKFTDASLIKGAAQVKGGKWKMVDSDEGIRNNLRYYSIEDWEWANKWINVTDYLKFKKKQLNL